MNSEVKLMENIIDDLWIVNNDGIVLFSSDEHTFDDNLFGAFLSAINMFVKEFSNDMLRNFEISDKRYVLIKEQNLLFVASTSNQVSDKSIKNKMNQVIERFLELYPQEFFKTWNYDTNEFDKFELETEIFPSNDVEEFLQAF